VNRQERLDDVALVVFAAVIGAALVLSAVLVLAGVR
jgi:hypothetical protein